MQGRAAASEPGMNPLVQLRRDMDRLFEDFAHGLFPFRMRMPDVESVWGAESRALQPAMDVVEHPDRYEVIAELPGLDEKNIQIRLSSGMLILTGEKKDEREEKDRNYHLSERRYGSFQRMLRLPDGVDEGRIEARFKKGILTVVVPKSEQAKRETTIPIKAA
jgi:HSP20 family protein